MELRRSNHTTANRRCQSPVAWQRLCIHHDPDRAVRHGGSPQILMLFSTAGGPIVCEYAGVDGICTEADVPDDLAHTTGILFLQQLFATGDLKAAYDLSRPANNRTYVYISGYRETKNMAAQQLLGCSAELQNISDKIEALDRAIRGDGYDTDGLITEFRQFKSDLLRYIDERRSWERGIESQLSRVELELQDFARCKAQPRMITVAAYIQALLFMDGLVALQLVIAWAAANDLQR